MQALILLYIPALQINPFYKQKKMEKIIFVNTRF